MDRAPDLHLGQTIWTPQKFIDLWKIQLYFGSGRKSNKKCAGDKTFGHLIHWPHQLVRPSLALDLSAALNKGYAGLVRQKESGARRLPI